MEQQPVPYKFSPIFEVINFSQKRTEEIRFEYRKLVEYYKENPYDLRLTMEQTINIALMELIRMIDEGIDAEKYFTFGEEMLLDDFRKIYQQIRNKYPISYIQNNEEVEVLFYSIGQTPDTPVGELLPSGQVNTGSKIMVDKMRLRAKDFLIQYQMLNN